MTSSWCRSRPGMSCWAAGRRHGPRLARSQVDRPERASIGDHDYEAGLFGADTVMFPDLGAGAGTAADLQAGRGLPPRCSRDLRPRCGCPRPSRARTFASSTGMIGDGTPGRHDPSTSTIRWQEGMDLVSAPAERRRPGRSCRTATSQFQQEVLRRAKWVNAEPGGHEAAVRTRAPRWPATALNDPAILGG